MRYTRRPEILRAAAKLIREKKLKVKLAHIADEAGVHRTIVTKTFKSVDEVLLDLIAEPLQTIRTSWWTLIQPENTFESFVYFLACPDSWFVVLAAYENLDVDGKPVQDILDEIFFFQLRRYMSREKVDKMTAQYHLRAIMGMILDGMSSEGVTKTALVQLAPLR